MMRRKEFLLTTGRYALYGVLALISAVSLKKAVKYPDTTCSNISACSDCGTFAQCTLDRAEEARSPAETRQILVKPRQDTTAPRAAGF